MKMFRTKKNDITLDLKNAEKQLRKLNKTIEEVLYKLQIQYQDSIDKSFNQANKNMNLVLESYQKVMSKENIQEPKVGDTILIGDSEWVILDINKKTIILLSKYCLTKTAFSNTDYNNWWMSDARHYVYLKTLNDLYRYIKDYGMSMFRDTTSLSGSKAYSNVFDPISLLTIDEYRRYREFIPNVKENWWLLTPRGVACEGDISSVVGVKEDGNIDFFDAIRNDIGIRPVMMLRTEFLERDRDIVSKVDEIIYKTREEIMKEIQKEMKK